MKVVATIASSPILFVEKCQLPDIQKARLAELWAADGLAEHSSIATFARFTLQLMVLGAPSDLLSRSQQAGKDEVEHARLCFQVESCRL